LHKHILCVRIAVKPLQFKYNWVSPTEYKIINIYNVAFYGFYMPEKPRNTSKKLQNVANDAQRYTGLALRTLASIARDPKSPATARVAAASRLLERGFGRASQAGGTASDPSALDDETLRRLIDQEDADGRWAMATRRTTARGGSSTIADRSADFWQMGYGAW
jgi:hypothetical protein